MSVGAIFRTLEGVPQGDITIQISQVTSTSLFATWNAPTDANGVIRQYEVVSTLPAPEVKHWEGISRSARLTNLIPYTYYTIVVRACTDAGCLESPGVVAETKMSSPTGQQPPVVTATSSTELFVQWGPPDKPNGM